LAAAAEHALRKRSPFSPKSPSPNQSQQVEREATVTPATTLKFSIDVDY
jgi:hypothetical protein